MIPTRKGTTHLRRWRAAIAALACALALLATLPARGAPKAVSLPMERDNWYAIKWENNLIGYSHFVLDQSVQLGGDQYYVLNSDSRVKLGPAEADEVIFSSRLLLNRFNLLPSYFIASQRQGKNVLSVECLFTPKLVAQKSSQGSPPAAETSTTVDVETPPYLVFNNVWGRVDSFLDHYAVLIAAWKAHGEKELSVYEPVLRGTETLRLSSEGTGSVSVLGRDVPARIVMVSDAKGQQMVKAYLSENGGRLLRLDDLHSGFTFTLSDARVEGLVKKAVGVNLYRNRVEFSNVFFPNATSLRDFKADLDAKVGGKAELTRDVKGFRQTFDGKIDDGAVKGTVTVQTGDVTVKKSASYPRRDKYDGDLAKYVDVEPGIEAKDEEMHSKGEEIAWRSRTSWEAAKKINTWVHDKVADGYSMPSGRFVLQHMSGNGESKALLVVTLLRAVNVPARKVTGIMFINGSFVPHAWVEVYVGDDGWVPMDPTTGEAGTLGATHVALGGGEMSSMDIKVLSFGPHPPQRVPFFNRELAWPVGQQRTYSVLHGGKEIGKEIATVKGLTSIEGKDAYEMEFSTDVTLSNKRVVGTSKLLTHPTALPLRFTVDASIDGQKSSHTYDFSPDAVKENVKVGEDTKVQETPVSQGVYALDPRFLSMYALIVGQLPNPAIGTKATVSVYNPDTHNTAELALQIRQEEKVGVSGEERETWRCESTDGVSFFIDKKSGQVIRIENPRQDLVLVLIESSTKI